MKNFMNRYTAFFMIIMLVLIPFSTVCQAANQSQLDEISAEGMAADFFLIRPLGIVATAAGTVLFVASFPFSALGGNIKEASKKMIAEPAHHTFLRPLGEF